MGHQRTERKNPAEHHRITLLWPKQAVQHNGRCADKDEQQAQRNDLDSRKRITAQYGSDWILQKATRTY